MRSKATAVSRSAITVVSAFASGKGATIGIDIPCTVRAELYRTENSKIGIRSEVADGSRLVSTSAENSLKYLHAKLPKGLGLALSIDSKIPTAIGLKSSSAVSVAVTKAIFDLFSKSKARDSLQEILKLSCKSSIQSGASLTGAFDDAAAGLLGGLVFSDNLKFHLLRHEILPDEIGTIVKILVPANKKKLTSSLNLDNYYKFNKESREALDYAHRGIFVQAMLVNSIIHSIIHRYSLQPIISAISEGSSASGITGKGPAVAAICPNGKISRRVESRWIEENKGCGVITASVTKPGTR
jgi:shikimate kinase